uniref:WD repeat domain 49 n=1 Tax=Astyanax mexicanus TaxID=7994 RepID=A0A8B9KPI6_ASTMX
MAAVEAEQLESRLSTEDLMKMQSLFLVRKHCIIEHCIMKQCITQHCITQHYIIQHLRFLGSLEAFLSCSTSANTSMALGWRESESRPLRITAFHTEKGITDLDFHPGLNLIATAGVNNQVCIWNPYVVTQPVGILRGHVTSVVAVQFMLGKRQLISFSKDKVLRVWDVANQLCIQRIAGIFPKTQDCKTLLFFHEERLRLFLSFNSALLLLEAKKDSGRRTLSHDSAVTCVLYNSLFRQVISSDGSSAVTCWLMDTGQKVKQFPHCHGNAEISTMALDATQTRLFTAGTDGVVKMWDFNGHCHHSLNAGRGLAVEISQILVLKRTILVFGWERMITVFRLNSFSQYFVQPAEWKGGVQHRDDVLCAAFRPPQTLVTGILLNYFLFILLHSVSLVFFVSFSLQGLAKVLHLTTTNLKEYCLHPSPSITNQAPVLLSSLRPHIDCVTHLETCEHSNQLYLLSASADCSLALSHLPGPTVGIFGQHPLHNPKKHVYYINQPFKKILSKNTNIRYYVNHISTTKKHHCNQLSST